MKKVILWCLLLTMDSFAATFTCPDPKNSSLKWGEIPSPWQLNPFSANRPQGGETSKFVRANILLAGVGRGVMCTYGYSLGLYSIWWPVPVKVPARQDYYWIESIGGFACNDSLEYCSFNVL